MPNTIDVTNMTSEQIETLLNDIVTGNKTFCEAVKESPGPMVTITEENDVKKMSQDVM